MPPRSAAALETIERNVAAAGQADRRPARHLPHRQRQADGRPPAGVADRDRRDRGRIAAARRGTRPASSCASRRAGPSARSSATLARLQQVVTNLLSNAVKFTPAGGRGLGRPHLRRAAGASLRSPTPASASTRRSCRTSSSASARPTPRPRAGTPASGSGSRSSSTWSSCTADRSSPRAGGAAPARSSASSSRPLTRSLASGPRRAATSESGRVVGAGGRRR